MDWQTVIERIRARLDELKLSSFEVSVQIGKNRNFLNDLLVGRKKSFKASLLPDLAVALNCDVPWLIGLQDAPRATGEEYETLLVVGSVEPGVWRQSLKDPSAGLRVPMRPDARYPSAQQKVWMVRGNALDGEMIANGTAILTADALDPAALFNQIGSGDLLVIERAQGDFNERTLLSAKRDAAGIVLCPTDGGEKITWTNPQKVPGGIRIAGLVLQVIRYRG